MERIFTHYIEQDFDHVQIATFLRHKGFSEKNLIKLKQMPNSVLVNGEHRFLIEYLHTGDVLTIHLTEQKSSDYVPPVQLPLEILYEDDDLLVINKAAGIPTHPSANHYRNSLANGLAWYFQQQKKTFVFRCSNRLDRDTSGLTIVSKHMLSANILSEMGKRREIHRTYLAIADGMVTPPDGTIDAPLGRKPGSVIERWIDWEHGESAITHYHLLRTVQKGTRTLSLVELKLETGRTHQIRMHMLHLGYPLIGDYLYHPDYTYIQRQALHAWKLEFAHPITGQPMSFTAPIPADMTAVLSSASNENNK